jgi:predicted nucleic acid-binding protein
MADSTVWTNAERQGVAVGDTIRRLISMFGDPEVFVSVFSIGELLHGWWRAEDAAIREARGSYIDNIIDSVPVVAVTLPVMRIFGELDARLAAAGRRLPTADMLIACSALHRGCDVVTGNVRHFVRVPGLKVHHLA